jgi:uncharacterized membrane protein
MMPPRQFKESSVLRRLPIPASPEFDRFAQGAQFRDRIAVVVKAVSILMTTSPGLGSGFGRSSIATWSLPRSTTAFMVVVMSNPLADAAMNVSHAVSRPSIQTD